MQDVNGKLFSEIPVRFVLLVWSLKENEVCYRVAHKIAKCSN